MNKISVTIKFLGDDLDPSTVSDRLNCRPTQFGRKGDPIVAHLQNGKEVSRPASTGYCSFDVWAEGPETVDATLSSLLSQMSDDLLIWKELSKQYSGQIVIENENPVVVKKSSFSRVTRKAIKKRKLKLYLNNN